MLFKHLDRETREMSQDPALETAAALKELVARVALGGDLDADEAEAVFDRFMDGTASQVQMAAFLTALGTKGIVAGEIAGGVRALRTAMVVVPTEGTDALVDTCGTGGGSVTTFNISTAAALVAAGAGVRIAKHGNRSFSSKCGSADVLEALGVRIEMSADEMERVLAEVGIVFMFAPLLHPAMRHVGPVRRELGFPTIMNILGPLTNPARVRRQVVGVADPALMGTIVAALRELGHHRAIVVHGEPGMDELSPLGTTHVAELSGEEISEFTVTPEDLGLERGDVDGLAGGEPAENAALIEKVLSGEDHGSARAATVLNAGAAIYVADGVETLKEGVAAAEKALDSGTALEKLEGLREASR